MALPWPRRASRRQETRLLAQLTALQQRIGRATAELFADLDGQLGADVRDMERELRLKREAASRVGPGT